MNKLKSFIISLAAIIIIVMMAATFVENSKGTAFAQTHIYSSLWFVIAWAILAVVSFIYMLKHRLFRRISVWMVHMAFLIILLGALTSWLTSKSGDVYLRQGVPSKELVLKDKTTEQLDFTLKLKDFKVINYPGTDAPMDYVSEITADNEPVNISMNNIGQYQGYRFTQAGYDEDMKGTHLGVYYDPYGIAITYIGYFILFVALLNMLISKRTNMRRFYHLAVDQQAAKALLLTLLLAMPAFLSPVQAQELRKVDNQIADDFGKICVLYNSRICPINTVATTFVTKLSGKPSWNGMTANQIFCGWVFDVANWENAKMIEVKSKEAQKVLGITGKWASFSDFWNQYNEYKLDKPLKEAYRSGNKELQKNLRDADEKFNIIRMLYNGELLRMYPYTDKKGNITWLAPGEKNVHGYLPPKEWYFVRKSMDYLAESIIMNNEDRAKTLISKIYDYQHIRGEKVIPSQTAIYAELTYNVINTLRWPIMLYLTVALLAVIASTIRLNDRKRKIQTIISTSLAGIMLLQTTIVIGLRWYISGHLPISNGYETMQFLAWSVLLITLLLRKRFSIILQYGPLLAAFALLVAMITDSNPQLTQLMPVLQSPLLSVHVMVIMFSYALFGLTALIGIQGIIAHIRKDTASESKLAALSQFLLYPAVALIAVGIFIGAIWANVSWGKYWSWDAKETWALITMLIYAAPLHNDIRWMHKPLHIHIYMLIAFLSVLMTYFGVNYFLPGMHSYA